MPQASSLGQFSLVATAYKCKCLPFMHSWAWKCQSELGHKLLMAAYSADEKIQSQLSSDMNIFWLYLAIHVLISSMVLFPQNKNYCGQLLQCQFASKQRALNMWGRRFLQDRWLLLVVARCRQSLACTRTGLWESGFSVEVEVGLGELHIQLCFFAVYVCFDQFFCLCVLFWESVINVIGSGRERIVSSWQD